MTVYDIMQLFIDPDSQHIQIWSDDEGKIVYDGDYGDIPEGLDYNVPLVKTQMKKIIVTAKTLYSHPKNVSKIYAALHTDLAW